MRRFLTRFRYAALLAALLCVLLMRAAVPAGWMPVAGIDGAVLAPCSGMGVARIVAHAMPGMAMHARDTPVRHSDPGGDHPCMGAGMNVALEVATIAPPRTPIVRPAAIVGTVQVATVGHGLAAPPPPPTGPPGPT